MGQVGPKNLSVIRFRGMLMHVLILLGGDPSLDPHHPRRRIKKLIKEQILS